MEIVCSLEELKSPRSVCGTDFPNFEIAGREYCFCSEEDHPEFPVQEESQHRGSRKPRKRIGFNEEHRSPS